MPPVYLFLFYYNFFFNEIKIRNYPLNYQDDRASITTSSMHSTADKSSTVMSKKKHTMTVYNTHTHKQPTAVSFWCHSCCLPSARHTRPRTKVPMALALAVASCVECRAGQRTGNPLEALAKTVENTTVFVDAGRTSYLCIAWCFCVEENKLAEF